MQNFAMHSGRSIVLALLVLAQCEFSCSLNEVSPSKLEGEISQWLTSEGLTPTSVSCPKGQRLEKGNRFMCAIDFDGVEASYEVEVTDPKTGGVEWKAKHLVIKGPSLGKEILALPELSGRTSIDCPPVLVSVPQSKWQCKVDDISTFNIEFTDGSGKYTWTFEGDQVSATKLQGELDEWLKSHGFESTSTTCPANQKLTKGHTFECTCTVSGTELPVAVEVTDVAKASLAWKPKYLPIKGSALELAIPALPELAGRSLTIDCPDVLISVPESKWTCEVTDKGAGDMAMVAELTFTDADGAYSWTLEPKR